MFVYCVCRPKLVVNICINWLPIIINLSVILGSQCSSIFFFMYLTKQSERNKFIVVVVVVVDWLSQTQMEIYWNFSRVVIWFFSVVRIPIKYSTLHAY